MMMQMKMMMKVEKSSQSRFLGMRPVFLLSWRMMSTRRRRRRRRTWL